MPDLQPEQQARVQIDAYLGAAGWLIQDYRQLNLSAARGIAIREVPLTHGRCDYLLTTLAGRLARLERELDEPARRQVREITGGPSLAELSAKLLKAIDPDVIAEHATGIPGAAPQEVDPAAYEQARKQFALEACQVFDRKSATD